MENPEIRPVVDPSELEQMIRQRAFELYVKRCLSQEDGTPEADWMLASLEIQPYVAVLPD